MIKKLTIFVFAMLSVATTAFAADETCEKLAKKAIHLQFGFELRDSGRKIEGASCETLKNRKGNPYKKCEVWGSNGNGAGDITFDVIMNDSCARVIALYKTGEE